MLRNKMIRAAIPKTSPIGFVDATSTNSIGGPTPNVTVSADDFVVAFDSGVFNTDISQHTFGGTSTTGTITDHITSTNGTANSKNNGTLDMFGSTAISGGGTLNLSSSGGEDAVVMGFLVADGGDSVSFTQGTSGSISVSSVTSDDLVVIYECAESSGITPPTLGTPSGYTSAFANEWVQSAGSPNKRHCASIRVSYKTGQTGTVAHTVTTAGSAVNTAIIIRIYTA